MGDEVISALIGLMGAVANHGSTAQTDEVIREAFLKLPENEEQEEEIVNKIHEVKDIIAPDCRTCKNPCGNTSDYDMERYYRSGAEIIAAKKRLIEVIRRNLQENEQVSEEIYRGTAYLGYELEEEEYIILENRLKSD